MDPQSSQSTRPRRKSLTRDQRVAVQTLRRYGLSLQAIANQLRISPRQVQYACQRSDVSDTRSPGRPPVLSSDQTDELVEYIRSSEDGRFMTYFELAIYPFAHWNVGEIAIRGALRRRGYRRCISQCKPPLTPENMQKRLLFARTHRDWTIEQWSQILWTDESWITGGQHRRVWVTRLPGEKYNEDCISSKFARRNGWMFWGSFYGTQKGPILIWDKNWGTLTSDSYCQHILPLIQLAKQANPGLLLMQDGAPCHAARNTMRNLRATEIEPIIWPPFSPDLNPIESVWNMMKDHVQIHHPEVEMGRQLPLPRLRSAITEAWNSISPEELGRLIARMPAKCQAVIDANGGPTRY